MNESIWNTLEHYRHVGFALVRLDDCGTIDRCTSAFAELLGRERASMEGQSMDAVTAKDTAANRTKIKDKDLDRFHASRLFYKPDGTITRCEVEIVKMNASHFLAMIWRPCDTATTEKLTKVSKEKDELTRELKVMHERAHELMLALIRNHKDAVDVKIFNQQSKGDGNENIQCGTANQ